MKTIQAILLSFFAVAVLSSCETKPAGSSDGGYSYPDPDPARISQDVQNTHSQILRQSY